MNTESKKIAERLGIDVSTDLSDEKQLEEIARKIGMKDYVFDDAHNKILNVTLRKLDLQYTISLENSGVNENVNTDSSNVISSTSNDYSNESSVDEEVLDDDEDETSIDETENLDDDTSEEVNAEEGSAGDSGVSANNGYGATGGFLRGFNGPDTSRNSANLNDPKKDEKNGSEKNKDNEEDKNKLNNEDGKKSKDEGKKSENKDVEKASNATPSMLPGAGYSKDSVANSKRDDINRKSFNHGERVNKGNSSDNNSTKVKPAKNIPNSSSSGNKSNGSNLKSKIKGKVKNVLDKTAKKSEEKNSSFRMAKNAIGSALKKFLLANPWIIFVIAFFALFLVALIVIMMFFADEEGMFKASKSSTHCSYNLSGVTSNGKTELDGVQVELINCSGTQSNYTVLETIDFEKYVLGVALAEIGPDAGDEALKAQIVAVRSFSLTRNSGMCPYNKDNCFYGYNATTNKIRMRACEADQVYWDYEKDIYRIDQGAISLYSPEINSGTLWKSALSEERKAQVLAIAEEVKGKVLLDENGEVFSTNYNSTTSNQFLANADKDYEDILNLVYGSDNLSSATCTSAGNIDYGDYVLSSDGHTILHQDLSSFLQSNGTSLEEFNSLIAENVEKAGSGTRAGVVAAAVTLIAELGNNYNVKVPYFWGGGHESAINDYAKSNWGSSSCYTYANNQSYNYCGLDCSGFVPWAIRNGGFNMSWARLAGTFQNISGASRVSLSNSAVLQPGDLLESSGHIVLVVGIDESASQYICAEASGNADGVLFTRRAFNSSGYWGVKMDGYYDNPANQRSN